MKSKKRVYFFVREKHAETEAEKSNVLLKKGPSTKVQKMKKLLLALLWLASQNG